MYQKGEKGIQVEKGQPWNQNQIDLSNQLLRGSWIVGIGSPFELFAASAVENHFLVIHFVSAF